MTEVLSPSLPKERIFVYRHSAMVRITHWINVVCIAVLIMSGLQIFNAHPALYIGSKSTFDAPVLSLTARLDDNGKAIGETKILGLSFNTTGVLGMSWGADGSPVARGFPSWITLPSYQDLATGRRWHFFFAWVFVINGLVYLIGSLLNRHLWRDLVPSREQIRGIGRSILEHLRLRFEHARDYNVLQKLTYLGLVIVVLPLIVLTGLTMSPEWTRRFPGCSTSSAAARPRGPSTSSAPRSSFSSSSSTW